MKAARASVPNIIMCMGRVAMVMMIENTPIINIPRNITPKKCAKILIPSISIIPPYSYK
jgi:hypothetical protein